MSIDSFHANSDRLYKVYEREYHQNRIDGNYDTPGLLAEELKRKIPEIEGGDKVLKTPFVCPVIVRQNNSKVHRLSLNIMVQITFKKTAV